MIALAGASLLAACGGGSGESASSAANSPPVPLSFSSGTSAAVVENSTGPVYAASAQGGRGTYTFAIAGGSDAARFTLAGSTLAFVSSPNYEAPGDVGEDNLYDVQLSVTDGAATVVQTIQIRVSNSKEGVAVRRIATGLTGVVFVAPMPGRDDIIMVARDNGQIQSLELLGGQLSRFYEVGNVKFLGLVFAADYATSGRFVTLSAFSNGQGSVCEHRGFGQNFLTGCTRFGRGQDLAQVSGWVGFHPDGTLLVATSENNSPGPFAPSPTASGRLLRIITPLSPDPYAGASVPPPAYADIASGFAKPSGGSFVQFNGQPVLILADRGSGRAQELNAVSMSGGNFGWPFYEGAQSLMPAPADVTFISPILSYLTGGGLKQGSGIVGGRGCGCGIASLNGNYVFADESGKIFVTRVAGLFPSAAAAAPSIERRDEDFMPNIGAIERPIQINEDNQGRLLILDADGELFRVEAG